MEGKRINVALIIILSLGFSSPLGAQTKIRVFSAAVRVSHRSRDHRRAAAAKTRRPIAFRTRPLAFSSTNRFGPDDRSDYVSRVAVTEALLK